MDRLYTMRVFTKVVDRGSFAAAARDLDMSPAAVTRAVAKLEGELGARLIHRTSRSLSLTSVGEIFLERARGIIEQIEQADVLIADAVTEPKGRLRILVPQSFAVHVLLERLPAFRERYPLISLELTTAGCHVAADDAYDISMQLVGGGWSMGNDFVARPIATTEVIACASPVRLLRDGPIVRPEDLAERDCLVYGSNGHGIWRFAERGDPNAQQISFQPRPVVSSIDADTLKAAAMAGMGYVGLPSYLVGGALKAGALVRLLPNWHVLTYRLYAAVPSRKYVPSKARSFINFLSETFGCCDRDIWLGPTAVPSRSRMGLASATD